MTGLPRDVKQGRLVLEVRRTSTTSTPLADSSCAAADETLRVTARILNCEESSASSWIARITEPPWLPVAPNTVRI